MASLKSQKGTFGDFMKKKQEWMEKRKDVEEDIPFLQEDMIEIMGIYKSYFEKMENVEWFNFMCQLCMDINNSEISLPHNFSEWALAALSRAYSEQEFIYHVERGEIDEIT